MAKEQAGTQLYSGRALVTMDRWHRYFVTIPELNKTVYQPGVTSIIGMKDKSGPLCYWTAEQCELFFLNRLQSLQDELRENSGQDLKTVSVEFVRKNLAEMRNGYRTAKKQAADIGSMTHDFLEAFLKWRDFGHEQPQRPKYNPIDPAVTQEMIDKANAAIDAGMKFFTEHEVHAVTLEVPVWSPTYGFIGTDDFIGRIDGEMVVADYKTSKRIYPEVWMQTMAYKVAYLEEHPKEKITARIAINVGKDGELDFQRRPAEFDEADFKSFLGLRDCYMWDRVHGYEPKGAIEIIGALPDVRQQKLFGGPKKKGDKARAAKA